MHDMCDQKYLDWNHLDLLNSLDTFRNMNEMCGQTYIIKHILICWIIWPLLEICMICVIKKYIDPQNSLDTCRYVIKIAWLKNILIYKIPWILSGMSVIYIILYMLTRLLSLTLSWMQSMMYIIQYILTRLLSLTFFKPLLYPECNQWCT